MMPREGGRAPRTSPISYACPIRSLYSGPWERRGSLWVGGGGMLVVMLPPLRKSADRGEVINRICFEIRFRPQTCPLQFLVESVGVCYCPERLLDIGKHRASTPHSKTCPSICFRQRNHSTKQTFCSISLTQVIIYCFYFSHCSYVGGTWRLINRRERDLQRTQAKSAVQNVANKSSA